MLVPSGAIIGLCVLFLVWPKRWSSGFINKTWTQSNHPTPCVELCQAYVEICIHRTRVIHLPTCICPDNARRLRVRAVGSHGAVVFQTRWEFIRVVVVPKPQSFAKDAFELSSKLSWIYVQIFRTQIKSTLKKVTLGIPIWPKASLSSLMIRPLPMFVHSFW